ncbi:TPA: hypothetical protein ACGR1C_004254 [Escherichia coli]
MRNKTENAALLKSIRRDLRGWEEGVSTHSDYGLNMGMVVLYAFGFGVFSFSLDGWALLLALLIWTAVSIGLSRGLLRRYGTSWAEEVDAKLAQYHPADLQAWEELKQSVAEGGVTLQAVQRWANQELRALTPPPAEQKWKMLQNKQGSPATPVQKQSVKPDAKEE